MDRNRLWASLQDRVPFRVAQRMLSANGFPKGTSWKAIEEKLAESEYGRASYSGLQNAFTESLAFSEKALVLYRLSDDGMANAYKAINKMSSAASASEYRDAYPYPLPEKQLSALGVHAPLLTSIDETDVGTTLIFCYPRVLEKRVELPTAALKMSGDRYASVFAIERSVTQAYGAVYVPHHGNIIQAYVDEPLGTPQATLETEHLALAIAFNDAGSTNVLQTRVNLFPAIGSLYQSEEGMVTHLGHTVATSVKHERMRGAGRCVRKELFHNGGLQAVDGKIAPFSIGITWGNDDETMAGFNPSLSLDGTYVMTYQATPTVDQASVRKCWTHEEAAFVVEKLLAHLPEE